MWILRSAQRASHLLLCSSSSNLKLLYVTPEKCSKSKQFMTKLQKLYQMGRLVRIAIGITKTTYIIRNLSFYFFPPNLSIPFFQLFQIRFSCIIFLLLLFSKIYLFAFFLRNYSLCSLCFHSGVVFINSFFFHFKFYFTSWEFCCV